jgi:hypothetical protein
MHFVNRTFTQYHNSKMTLTSISNDLLNDHFYDKVWFHAPLGTRETFSNHKCQSLTTKNTSCPNNSSYLCKTLHHSQQYEQIYVCGMHFNKVDVQKFPIAYQKTWKHHWDDWTVIRQIHSPDTYMEHSYKLHEKYMKICDSLKTLLETLDSRAIQIGDLDGSYPLEFERLTTILEKRQCDIGCDLYNIFKTTHHEINRLRKAYLEKKNRLNSILSLNIPEIEYFKKMNVISLTMSRPDVCSICLENVSSSNEGGQLAQCKHTFHNKCLTKWITNKNTCPCCRTPLCKLLYTL